MSFYTDVADVLEKVAEHLDAQDHEKTAAAVAGRRELVAQFEQQYAQATGEDLDPALAEKLASSDENLLAAFQKLAERVSTVDGEPDNLGGPSNTPNDHVYMNKAAEMRARAQEADYSFLNFIME